MSHRPAFSPIEVLLVLIVVTFVGVLLPPVLLEARTSSRRTQCLNNLKNIALATHSFATEHKGALPYLTGDVYDSDPTDGEDIAVGDVFLTVSRSGQPVERQAAGWPVVILPDFDQTALYEALLEATVGGDRKKTWNVGRLLGSNIPGFTCPEDRSLGDGLISYVVNAGIVPESSWRGRRRMSLIEAGWQGAMSLEDRERINLAAGVFVRPAVARYVRGGPRVYDRRQTLDTISRGDGVTQTMMFSENTAATRWSRTRLGDIGFAWAASDRRGFVRPAKKPGGFGNAAGPLAFEKLPDDAPWLPSSRPTSTEGTAPRPSAMHDGGILAGYCDGHAGRVSEDIDPSVYVRLLTPNGNACGQEPLPKNADF